MVDIIKGDKRMTVTSGAYNEIYKSAGWEKLETVKKQVAKVIEPEDDFDEDEDAVEADDVSDDDVEQEDVLNAEELAKKPISELTGPEIKVLAAAHNINIEGKSKKEAKKLLRSTLQ